MWITIAIYYVRAQCFFFFCIFFTKWTFVSSFIPFLTSYEKAFILRHSSLVFFSELNGHLFLLCSTTSFVSCCSSFVSCCSSLHYIRMGFVSQHIPFFTSFCKVFLLLNINGHFSMASWHGILTWYFCMAFWHGILTWHFDMAF